MNINCWSIIRKIWILLFGMVIITGCKGNGVDQKESVAAPTRVTVSTASSMYATASTIPRNVGEMRAAILKAFRLKADTSYRQKSITLVGSQPYNTLVEYVAPNKYHIVNTTVTAITTSTELIVVGEQVYIKNSVKKGRHQNQNPLYRRVANP